MPATNRQIADEVFLSVDAVKGHLRALFKKFGVDELPQNQKRARLVEIALQSGLASETQLDNAEPASRPRGTRAAGAGERNAAPAPPTASTPVGVVRRIPRPAAVAGALAAAAAALALAAVAFVGGGAVSEREAEAVVERFSERYAAEDIEGVMATLTDDAKLVFESALTGTERRSGRAALRHEFSGEFRLTEGYRLALRGTDTAKRGTIVTGDYTRKASGIALSGTVSFEVVESDGQARIKSIRSTASL